MNSQEFADLQEGDRVRLVDGDGSAYSITGNYGDYVMAIRTMHVSNPQEWLVDGAPIKSVLQLKPGNQVKHASGGRPYIITSVHDGFAFAMQSMQLTRPSARKWIRSAKAAFSEIT